ncbi:nuclear transcription factor Y subunit B-7 [Beta vulgaris subsp. vulgaris]|uniref:nuclear transcription factor Y subunit B-7 n=1 Tax=Beta vulgaris subsp. vulgaris TaxID=3555 RepID=UPI0025486A4A|nr:nuclear transcription factor Y subunit B-7 [Beta vulgaris subsp. vulgaris]
MEDESHQIKQESLESPCSKNKSYNNNNNNNANNNNNNASNNKEQDRFLPIANVGRIMKKVIPNTGKISKDAKETVQECVSEFISFVTGEASDKCQREKRKTINGDDIIWAITTLGFEDYVNPLKLYLNKYRDIEGEKVNVPKQQRSAEQLHQLPQQQQQQHAQNHQRLLHHHQQDHHQFHQQVDQGLSPYATSVYSSANTLLLPQPSFPGPEQPYPLPFSPNSIQKNYQHQEQIDSVGHW